MAAPGQAATRDLAAHLEACLEPARQAFARLCPELCPACDKVCCLGISPHGLLDQVDLIYFAALGLNHLPYPRPRERGCPFLEAEGCLLPWRARPYACLHYVCPRLSAALSGPELAMVEQALERAGQLRARLHAAFVDPD
ncbi:MAG: hypothetical protein HY794_11110 [Desulfarculus sp.]|nr:hypothetical protein [Desulfarculus sp.]